MYSLFDSAGNEYSLDRYLLPDDMFDFARDASLSRINGATNNSLVGDSFFKAPLIKLKGKKRYSSVSARDTAIGSLKSALSTAVALVTTSYKINIQQGFVIVNTGSTTIDAVYNVTLIPTGADAYQYNPSGLFWNNDVVQFTSTAYTYGG